MKILFNCLVYKDIDVVEDMINNVNKFIENPVIILHVNQCFEDFDFDRIAQFKNVYINSERFSHGRHDTKIKALVSNKDFILNNDINFDYEIILYPKMLFIKKGIENYLEGSELCMPLFSKEEKDEKEWMLNINGFMSLGNIFTEEEKEFFNNKLEKCLVEGMSFSKDLSNRIYDFIKQSDLYHRTGHCYEEFIFPTVAYHLAKNIRDYSGIVDYWEMGKENATNIINNTISSFTSFFNNNKDIKDVYFIHQVEYGYDNEIRKLVRER